MIKVAVVKFTAKKTCFLTIPKNWPPPSQHEQHTYEIQKDGRTAYLTWNGKTSVSKDIIKINREYCHHLGFAENDEVTVKEIIETIANCERAILKPPNADGFEVIDLNKTAIELQLMEQIRVIWNTQVFPLWINNIQVLVKVCATLPNSCPVMLVNETFLDIEDVSESVSQSSANNLKSAGKMEYNSDVNIAKSKLSYLKYGMSYLRNALLGSTEIEYDGKVLQNDNAKLLTNESINLTLRVNPVENHFFVSECASHYEMKYKLKGINYPSAVYISSAVLPDNGKGITGMFLAKISKLSSPLERIENKNNDKQGARKRTSGKKKYLSSVNESFNAKDSLNKEKHFSSSIVQVIVLNDIERSCSSCVKDELNITLGSDSAIIPDCLRKMLGLEIGSRIYLQNIDHMPSNIDIIHLHPLSPLSHSSAMNIISVFLSWFENVYDESLPFIFCNGNIVTLPIEDSSVDFVLMASLSQESGTSTYHLAEKDDTLRAYWNISPSFLYKKVSCKLESIFTPVNANGISLPSPLLCLIDKKVEGCDITNLGGIKTVFEKGWQFLELWLNISPMAKSLLPSKEHNAILLICGPKGVGKTALCQALCKKVSQSPHHVYCHYISCRALKGKRGETLWKSWRESCLDVIYREPAVLLIDDLDLIASAPTTPEEEVAASGIHFQKIVHAFLNLCDYVKSSDAKVIIIVTAKSFQSIHPLLTSTRGEHVFQCKIEINCPSKDQREQILKALVESKLNIKLNETNLFHKLALKTEGFVAQDLDTLVNRATHVAWMRNDLSLYKSQPIEVNLIEADFNAALQNFIPSSLQSVLLHKSGNKQWSDVGGLSHVKDTLHKILLWPAKYSFLFTNCPLRLQSGILLYGPPGTGKTLIAGVLAKESGLNFIHIKGPELLSKYIGASEQALRNAFANAQNAKPCILFFDEFDALAPRRGHDSTGVTDRVVNQMLTQMDGVESLNGVYILAATSRPDLIDPALLRPGRLDKHLYCPLPDKDDRLQILQALSHKLCLSEDVDLPAIADLTTNFSGADLQALLYSAQIESLHQVQNNTNQEKKVQSNNEDSLMDPKVIYFPSIEEGSVKLDSETQQRIQNEVAIIQRNISNSEQIKVEDYDKPSFVYINQKNLMVALDKMRPSVSPSERTKYQLIYSRFGRRATDTATSADFGGKRVTLA